MTTHLKATRIWARGKPLLNATLVTFICIALCIGAHKALVLVVLAAVSQY
jgi:hypothetical protein